MKNYSQNNEQEIILAHFRGKTVGSFLDIGAYNGPDISNTWALLEMGWRGVMVEPNPYNLVDLIKNVEPYADRVEIICASAYSMHCLRPLCIERSPGRGWAASFTKVNTHIDPSPVKVFVPTVGFFNGPFDFISIDAEGDDLNVLHLLNREDLLSGCKMVVIEAVDRPSTYLALKKYGFSIHAETPENIIAVK